MVASAEFGSYLCDELSPLGAVSLRRMFVREGRGRNKISLWFCHVFG
jgi:hypothetical protein